MWRDWLGSVGSSPARALSVSPLNNWGDPMIAVCIRLWTLPRPPTLLRETENILLEGFPNKLTLRDASPGPASAPNLNQNHSANVWSTSLTDASRAAHFGVRGDEEEIRTPAAHVVKQSLGVQHVTIQTERTAYGAMQGVSSVTE